MSNHSIAEDKLMCDRDQLFCAAAMSHYSRRMTAVQPREA